MAYVIGGGVELTCTFTTPAGAVADPATVTFTLIDPAGDEVVYTYGVDGEITRSSTGIYGAAFTVSLAGTYSYRWAGVGTVASASEGALEVLVSGFGDSLLEVEDGTGSATANSYCTVAFADAYHLQRGNTGWTGIAAVKEQALIRATDFLDQRYRFVGVKASRDQALEWPRANVEDAFGRDYVTIPDEVKRACAEAALQALTAALIPIPTYDAGGIVSVIREKVGPIETETSYRGMGPVPLKRWPHIDLILKKFTLHGNMSVRG